VGGYVPKGDHLQRVNVRRPFFSGFLADTRDIWAYRELLVNLTRKELKVKYKDSSLGFLWTLVRPLLQLLVYSLAIGLFLGVGRSIPDFGIFMFAGLLSWTLFTEIVGGSTGAIVGNAGLIKKVYFPREVLLLALGSAATLNFFLQSLVLVPAYAGTGAWPLPRDLWLVPLSVAVVVTFSLALGLLLASANVFLRDIQWLVEVGLLLVFWCTPIIYPWTRVKSVLVDEAGLEWLFQIYMANPMTNVSLAMQQALWPGIRTEQGAVFAYDGDLGLRLLVCLVCSAVLLWLAQRVFARSSGSFAQEL
jgi:ABC-2 type transport system permease protein